METQPIPAFVSSPGAAAANGDASQPRPRGPHPERRVTRANTRARTKSHAPDWKPPHITADQLLNTYSAEEIDKLIINILQGKERKSARRNTALENRITKDVKKTEKKEPSPAKLEKIQKRREVRAEKKKVWLEKKAAQGNGADAPDAPEPAAESATGKAPAKAAAAQEDVINFDEL